MPEPLGLVVKNGMKIRPSTSGRMPSPLSWMMKIRSFPFDSARTWIEGSLTVAQASRAFFNKFRKTCSICARSASHSSDSSVSWKWIYGSGFRRFRSAKNSLTEIRTLTGGAMRVSFSIILNKLQQTFAATADDVQALLQMLAIPDFFRIFFTSFA